MPLRVETRRAHRKFLKQMLPFIVDLTRRDRNGLTRFSHLDFGRVEGISTIFCFNLNAGQEGPDQGNWRGGKLESLKLRVILVSPGFSSQYCLGKQGLSPENNQPLPVEILRMNGPEPQR